MVFLDNQSAFDEVFGYKPKILPPNPVMSQDVMTTANILYSFGEKFKLYVFMYMCRRYYVGHDSVDNPLIVQYVCRHIS